ncbi:hypothetical protein EGW08_006936 [Elysia chlorotica]|uniref:Uncharacterized protein n=1 Tax=Elysia chlorotica TaxID=188477 RepID=A0A433TUS2_ELYCH|nr:hypothetical protein EGW08_006936 [Elysia chlorotica]
MNISNTMNLPPNTFRRVLTEHGRSSAPGLLESPMTPELKTRRRLQPRDKEVTDSLLKMATNPSEASNAKKDLPPSAESELASKIDKHAPFQYPEVSADNKHRIKTPVSKIRNTSASSPNGSFSFYKRSFRVNGKQAWEYAMRDLGSIDTLNNRYGYVEPHQRQDITPLKRPLGQTTKNNAEI